MPEFVAQPRGAGRRIAVIASRFNEFIVKRLVDGALEALVERGTALEDIDVVWVPGAWELPSAARFVLEKERYDAIVALGVVIRGETAHFDYVAGEAARGLQKVALDFGSPVAFGVLTTNDEEQALARAGGPRGNKGADAALAALEMAELFDRLDVVAESERDGNAST